MTSALDTGHRIRRLVAATAATANTEVVVAPTAATVAVPAEAAAVAPRAAPVAAAALLEEAL